MKIIAVIPARYASTRFHAKLMQDLGGKTVILRTYEASVATKLFDDVFVVNKADRPDADLFVRNLGHMLAPSNSGIKFPEEVIR